MSTNRSQQLFYIMPTANIWYTTGSDQHVNMMEHVNKSSELIVPHCEQLGKIVFRCVSNDILIITPL